MHTVKLTMEDSIYKNIMFLLSNLNVKGLTIEEESMTEDWSHLESEIDKGLNSEVCSRSHEDIISDIKKNMHNFKYSNQASFKIKHSSKV